MSTRQGRRAPSRLSSEQPRHTDRSLATAAGGMVSLGLLTAALATRLASITTDVDLQALASGTPTVSALAPLVEIPLVGIGCVVAAWWSLSLALVTLALVGQSLGLRSSLLITCIRAVAPAAVRRIAVVGVGAGLVLTASPALAAEPVPDLGWVSTGTSDPEVTPPETVEAVLPEPAPTPSAPTVPTSPTGPDGATIVTVAAGDSLWSITERILAPGASDAEIAAAWPAIHSTNVATIGADPDILVVGQQLLVPPHTPSPQST